jgi:mannose-6-phosphate isomerase-like protein (cupin superfamily)
MQQSLLVELVRRNRVRRGKLYPEHHRRDGMQVYNVQATLAAAPTLDATMTATREEAVSTLRQFGELDGYKISGRRFRGTSPWELHPNEDELLYVIEGQMEVTLLVDDGETTVTLKPGCLFVVPKGTWHRQFAKETVTSWGVTATASDEISFADDPRRGSDAD